MTNVETFQKKLADICTLAKLNGKRITKAAVAHFFQEDGLQEQQLEKVLDYLRVQGIRITDEMEEETEPEAAGRKAEKVPLTPEEEAYLKEYKKTLKVPGEGSVLEDHMWRVIELAEEYHYAPLFIGDLIQEGNISLMLALEAEQVGKTAESIPKELEERLETAIRQGMEQLAKEQAQQKYEDDFLVEKVRHLEESIRELADGVGEKSSIEELSAYLDMEEEEIRAVLRLTGDLDD